MLIVWNWRIFKISNGKFGKIQRFQWKNPMFSTNKCNISNGKIQRKTAWMEELPRFSVFFFHVQNRSKDMRKMDDALCLLTQFITKNHRFVNAIKTAKTYYTNTAAQIGLKTTGGSMAFSNYRDDIAKWVVLHTLMSCLSLWKCASSHISEEMIWILRTEPRIQNIV